MNYELLPKIIEFISNCLEQQNDGMNLNSTLNSLASPTTRRARLNEVFLKSIEDHDPPLSAEIVFQLQELFALLVQALESDSIIKRGKPAVAEMLCYISTYLRSVPSMSDFDLFKTTIAMLLGERAASRASFFVRSSYLYVACCLHHQFVVFTDDCRKLEEAVRVYLKKYLVGGSCDTVDKFLEIAARLRRLATYIKDSKLEAALTEIVSELCTQQRPSDSIEDFLPIIRSFDSFSEYQPLQVLVALKWHCSDIEKNSISPLLKALTRMITARECAPSFIDAVLLLSSLHKYPLDQYSAQDPECVAKVKCAYLDIFGPKFRLLGDRLNFSYPDIWWAPFLANLDQGFDRWVSFFEKEGNETKILSEFFTSNDVRLPYSLVEGSSRNPSSSNHQPPSVFKPHTSLGNFRLERCWAFDLEKTAVPALQDPEWTTRVLAVKFFFLSPQEDTKTSFNTQGSVSKSILERLLREERHPMVLRILSAVPELEACDPEALSVCFKYCLTRYSRHTENDEKSNPASSHLSITDLTCDLTTAGRIACAFVTCSRPVGSFLSEQASAVRFILKDYAQIISRKSEQLFLTTVLSHQRSARVVSYLWPHLHTPLAWTLGYVINDCILFLDETKDALGRVCRLLSAMCTFFMRLEGHLLDELFMMKVEMHILGERFADLTCLIYTPAVQINPSGEDQLKSLLNSLLEIFRICEISSVLRSQLNLTAVRHFMISLFENPDWRKPVDDSTSSSSNVLAARSLQIVKLCGKYLDLMAKYPDDVRKLNTNEVLSMLGCFSCWGENHNELCDEYSSYPEYESHVGLLLITTDFILDYSNRRRLEASIPAVVYEKALLGLFYLNEIVEAPSSSILRKKWLAQLRTIMLKLRVFGLRCQNPLVSIVLQSKLLFNIFAVEFEDCFKLFIENPLNATQSLRWELIALKTEGKASSPPTDILPCVPSILCRLRCYFESETHIIKHMQREDSLKNLSALFGALEDHSKRWNEAFLSSSVPDPSVWRQGLKFSLVYMKMACSQIKSVNNGSLKQLFLSGTRRFLTACYEMVIKLVSELYSLNKEKETSRTAGGRYIVMGYDPPTDNHLLPWFDEELRNIMVELLCAPGQLGSIKPYFGERDFCDTFVKCYLKLRRLMPSSPYTLKPPTWHEPYRWQLKRALKSTIESFGEDYFSEKVKDQWDGRRRVVRPKSNNIFPPSSDGEYESSEDSSEYDFEDLSREDRQKDKRKINFLLCPNCPSQQFRLEFQFDHRCCEVCQTDCAHQEMAWCDFCEGGICERCLEDLSWEEYCEYHSCGNWVFKDRLYLPLAERHFHYLPDGVRQLYDDNDEEEVPPQKRRRTE